MYLEIGLIIFGIALLLLVLFCIPILLKLWRAASDVTVTLQALNERLPAILKNMEEISTILIIRRRRSMVKFKSMPSRPSGFTV